MELKSMGEQLFAKGFDCHVALVRVHEYLRDDAPLPKGLTIRLLRVVDAGVAQRVRSATCRQPLLCQSLQLARAVK